MVMKDAFAILRADKQLQSSVHDFALCFQAREFFRLADEGFVDVDVGASHKLIIHQFCQDWCIDAEELITVPDEPSLSLSLSLSPPVKPAENRGREVWPIWRIRTNGPLSVSLRQSGVVLGPGRGCR
jgi:hypothetical protein